MQLTIPVTAWQRAALEDESQFELIVAGRQSGKSDFLAKKSVKASLQPRPNLDVLLSRGERQSLELMEKLKVQCRALNAAVGGHDDFFKDTSLLQHTVTFPNGNRVIALPANPDTARGYTGNIRLDEFALHKDSREIWAAAAPIATRGYEITVCSTFKGTENKFYELAKMLGLHDGVRPERQPVQANGWGGHWVDIHMSAEQTWEALGIRIDVEKLRAAIDDEEVWLQEFCNVPMSSAENFIPIDLILACEAEEASIDWDGARADGLYAGMDIGRKKDRSVIWILRRVDGRLVTVGVIWMDRLTFAEQLSKARVVAAATQRMSVDATGIGAMLAETLHEEFPWVEQVTFTAEVKERMAVEMKRRMEERGLALPEDRRIRRGFGAIKRSVGPTGVMRFDAARTGDGHADEFWAAALGCAAASQAAGYVPLDEGMVGGETVLGGFRERVF